MSDHDPQDSGPLPSAAPPAQERAEEAASPAESDDPRWRLVVDVVTFQGKLVLDAVRDILLSPISIVVAIIGAVTRPSDPGTYFYELMRWGRWSDHFIGLFNAGLKPDERHDTTSVDDIVETLERVVRDEYYRGGVSAEARAQFERTLKRLEDEASPEQRRIGYQLRQAADKAREEAQKLRDKIKGPGEE